MLLKKKISPGAFKAMHGIMNLIDKTHPYVPARAESFGVKPGMAVVDYGCGPGRYAAEFARLVGPEGKVYAVDIIEIALEETKKRLAKDGATNVELKLANGYDSGIPADSADMVCAVDMFHHVDSAPFLKEAHRIAKPDGALLISGSHMLRGSIKKAVAASGLWEASGETTKHMAYRKKQYGKPQ